MDAREMNTLAGELVNYDGQQRYVNKLEDHGCVTVADVRHAMNNPDKMFRQIGTGGWSNIRYALDRFAANEPVENSDEPVKLVLLISPAEYSRFEKAAGSDGVLVWGLAALRDAAKVKGRKTR